MSEPDNGDFNRAVIDEFHANAGVVGGPFAGRTLLLLHSIGARSGHPRVTPLAYLTIDGRMFVVGSYAGAPRDPAWVHNLRADPHARIEVGSDAYDVSVRELPLPERGDVPRGGGRRRRLRRTPSEDQSDHSAVRTHARLICRRG